MLNNNKTYNLVNGSICTANQHDDTNGEAERVEGGLANVLLLKDATLLDELEPHHGGEVEGETRDEQRRRDGQALRDRRWVINRVLIAMKRWAKRGWIGERF